jgi:hypothetical protein
MTGVRYCVCGRPLLSAMKFQRLCKRCAREDWRVRQREYYAKKKRG